MPMPPPRASNEPPRDRHVPHEIAQIVRVLQTEGPQTEQRLQELIGAAYWEPGRFDRALAATIADGLAIHTSDGTLTAI